MLIDDIDIDKIQLSYEDRTDHKFFFKVVKIIHFTVGLIILVSSILSFAGFLFEIIKYDDYSGVKYAEIVIPFTVVVLLIILYLIPFWFLIFIANKFIFFFNPLKNNSKIGFSGIIIFVLLLLFFWRDVVFFLTHFLGD